MTFQEEIAAVQLRIAKAKSDRDTWRISGMQDNYLEAHSLVDALELQLERLRQEGLRAFARAPEPASVCALLASTASAIADAPSERARIMAKLSISGSEESGPMPPRTACIISEPTATTAWPTPSVTRATKPQTPK